MDKNCFCNPVQLKFEFPIIDNECLCKLVECPETINLCEIKNKIICEFLDLINKLKCGIQPDLEFLLLEISLVYIYD